MLLMAIDPGNIDSAYVIVDEDMCIHEKGKVKNETLRQLIIHRPEITEYAIEMIASYGMAVGKEVFETCVWIGRFAECAVHVNNQAKVSFVYRAEEKQTICKSMKANDSNIRQALIDMYAQHDFKNGKGTKSNPDYFHGFAKDIWAAFAVAHTYMEKLKYGI